MIVSTPDFAEYKKALAEYIKSKPGFEDYNFEASTLNILTDILAFNAQQLGWNTNMAYSEMFMDSSFLRETVISHAQLIGYFPASIKSAEAKIRLTLTGTPNATILIPKDFEFNAKGTKNQDLRFSVKESHSVLLNGSGSATVDIIVVEGTRKLYRFKVSEDKTKFVVPIPNIDISSLIVKVFPNSASQTFEFYYQFKNLFELTEKTNVFWIYETLNNSYQIQFGDGIIGNKLLNNNIVQLEYLLSSGSAGNGAKAFTPRISLPGISNISITTLTPGVGGTDKESTESIKSRAPLNYAVQNRAVTKNDYKILIENNFDDIGAISVWGGESNPIPYYGRVFFSIKPISKERLTDLEVESIVKFLSDKQVITNSLEHKHPEIIDVILKCRVWKKNQSQTNGIVESQIKLGVVSYANSELSEFNSELKYSKLIEAIDDSSITIDHNLTDIKLGYTLYPQFNVKKEYTIEFDNALVPGSFLCRSVLYLSKDSIIKDDGLGVVAIYRPINNVLVKISEIGTINYVTGLVYLNSFVPEFDGASFLDFIVTPDSYSIKTKNNKLLQIVPENIEVLFQE